MIVIGLAAATDRKINVSNDALTKYCPAVLGTYNLVELGGLIMFFCAGLLR